MYLAHIFKFLYLCIRSNRSCLFIYPLLLIFISGLSFLVGTQVGLIPGLFYRALVNRDLSFLIKTVLWRMVTWISIISILETAEEISEKIMSTSLRSTLSYIFNKKYFEKSSQPYLNLESDNPDQRIVQDVNFFCLYLSQITRKVGVIPLTIIFYSIMTYLKIGIIGLLICYIFFIIGAVINKILSLPVVPKLILQDKLEGTYRVKHVQIRKK